MNDNPDHDSQTFREAMRDVRRLRDTSKRAPTAPKPPPRAALPGQISKRS